MAFQRDTKSHHDLSKMSHSYLNVWEKPKMSRINEKLNTTIY
jgi:hypothetical protein